MKISIQFIALLVFSSIISAQSIAPDVIASNGNSSNIQLNWTLGEVMVDTYSNGSNILTQGFHQTNLTITTVEDPNLLDLHVNVYPNPSSDRIIIEVSKSDKNLLLELYDMSGKLVLTETIPAEVNRKELNLSALATSYYLLKMFSNNGEIISTYKIQKTSN